MVQAIVVTNMHWSLSCRLPATGSSGELERQYHMVTVANDPALSVYDFWQAYPEDGWLMSDWPAGQSNILHWSADNVRVTTEGHVELVLGRAPDGSGFLYQAGEVQSAETAITGTWSWTVRAPEMVPGAVFGLFTYKADWANQPWVEFDFEFVGADTTRVQLNIHMVNEKGEHITLDQHGQKPVFIDLGFDAAEGVHTYEVTVTESGAIFYIDGKIVGEFSGADMPGGVWQIGPMKSYINLWAVQPEQEIGLADGLRRKSRLWQRSSAPRSGLANTGATMSILQS